MVGDPDLAEDVAQEAFLRAWRNAQAYDSRRGSVHTWMLVITRSLAIDAMTCAELEALAAELALGTVSGAERAGALDHLAGCAACRTLVEELAGVADRFTLARQLDLPAGDLQSVRVLDAGGRVRYEMTFDD